MVLWSISNPLGWLSMYNNELRIPKMCNSRKKSERFIRKAVAIRVLCSRRPSKGLQSSQREVQVFLIVLSQSLIKFLHFSRGRVHDLFDRWNHIKLCVDFLYIKISYLLSSFYCSMIISFYCTNLQQLISKYTSSLRNNQYQSKVKAKMSVIKYDIQKFDDVINFSM